MKLSHAVVDRLVSEHYANLYRFALSLTGIEAEASDLTQQAYFQLATKGGQIRDLSKAKSWLFTTLHREFLALRRHTGRFATLEELDHEPETHAEIEPEAVRRADARIVVETLNRIPEIFRVPLALFYLEDLSYREIAEFLNVPMGTVMSRLSRGKRELRLALSRALVTDSDPANVVPFKAETFEKEPLARAKSNPSL